ncbi:MAG TPA: DUF4157 domain-containing protein [Sphingopyxis sp.]|nr:DUF4157 domain-containing protein [Sphingopyxis sp.]HMQ17710.1 DUF4157 domain-containing protein [Sphingopyxis sp.]
MSALAAHAAKAHASHQTAPPVMRRAAPQSRHAPSPIASLAAIPAGPAVQRQCAACEQEETEESAVQPRLEVGPVGDRYEREADSIAAQVMAMPDPAAALAADASAADGAVQRACSACSPSHEEPRARRFADPEEEGDAKVRARRDGGAETIAASDADLTRGGAPLPAATRGFFESRMGRDLGDVRVHQGGEAAARNESIAARAFTYKSHVWLGSGESAGPTFTMAHELAHVMQQTAPGPVGPQRREASEAGSVVQRSAPFFMQGSKKTPSHAKMHEVAQKAIRKHNTDLLTEVPIPGANRKTVSLGKCGFADFYTANPKGGLIPVPGVEAVEAKAGSGTLKLQNFTAAVSKSSCVGTIAFDKVKRGDKDYPLDSARGPVLDAAGKVGKLDSAPTGVKVGELKPAHDINYRGSGVTQLNNYIAGIEGAAAETNRTLGGGQSWNPSPSRWTTIALPPGWDASGTDATTTWPIPDLKIRSYDKPPALPAASKKKKGKGAAPPTAKDVESGSNVKISGRWMLAKDSTRISGGDGVYVYFLAPNPDDLTRALKSRKTSAEFRKLAAKVREVYKPLLATPDVKKAARKQPLPAPEAPRRPAPMRLRPRVQRKAVDPFNRGQWELLRTGSFDGKSKSGSLAELFATTPSQQHREQAAEIHGIAEWLQSPPETAKGVTYSKQGANEGDPAVEDFDTLRKAAFWAGSLATPIGVLRERFGKMFIKGHAAFVKVKKKIRSVFKNAKFSTGSGSGIGAHAAKIVGKIFMQLGKVVLARTADIIVQCMQSGFAAFMKKQVDGSIDELLAKAEEAKISAEKLKEDVEEKIKAALEPVISGYEKRIKEIADDARVIAAIAGAVSEIVRIARLAFCVSGLAAAGWGAIVTCLLSVADWIASKFDASPLDAIIKRVMGSCRGRKIFAEALMSFEAIRSLPTLLAKTVLRPIKANLPSPADEMFCDIEALKVPDLSIADFECKSGDGEGDGGDGGGGGDGDEDEEGDEGAAGTQAGESTGGGSEAGGQQSSGETSGGQDGKAGSAADAASSSAGGSKPDAGKSSTTGDAVKKGQEQKGQGIIEEGLNPGGSYNNSKVRFKFTMRIEDHVFRNVELTWVVVKVARDAQGPYAEVYLDPNDIPAGERTLRVEYPDKRYYEWTPHRGKQHRSHFRFRKASK